MILNFRNCYRIVCHRLGFSKKPSERSYYLVYSSSFGALKSFRSIKTGILCPEQRCLGSSTTSSIDIFVAKIRPGSSDEEVFLSLSHDQTFKSMQLSHTIVAKLLNRFKDDWKSAFGIFRWAEGHFDYKHAAESYDMMVDILGKAKQFNLMWKLLEDTRWRKLIRLNTVAKAMRRLSGAGEVKELARMFDELSAFGLEKNTESMNLLLDTLCKEGNVEKARAAFLELKSHIKPNAHTFNIFIHGWCKVNRVDEAYWTIQEMKGYGCSPCVISYSTIIELYSCRFNFRKVYELLDEMEARGCPANVVTYTIIVSSLAKAKEYDVAVEIAKRMKSAGCKADTLFYNSLIHTLGRAGRVEEAASVFEEEMQEAGVSRNTSTYNTMIAMFCHHAQEQRAFGIFEEMKSSELCEPDVQTFYPLLKSCLKTGKTDTILNDLLDDMVNNYHLSLDLSTYTLLIHGFCRVNKCEQAYILFEEMTSKEIIPKYRTCSLLLSECKQKNMYDAAESVEDFMGKL